MAKNKTIVIEADDDDELDDGLIPIKLVGKEYLIRKPKLATTLDMAEEVLSGGFTVKIPKGLSKAEREKLEQEQADKARDLLKGMKQWIKSVFGKEGAKDIYKRFQDPEDRLDIPHIMKLMSAVNEASTGDPTT